MALALKLKSAVASLFLVGLASQAQALPLDVTATDLYWGNSSYNSDTIGNIPPYQIYSARVQNVSGNLVVTITTDYSGSHVGNLGTTLGDLFLGTLSALDYNGADDNDPTLPVDSGLHKNDKFTADTNRFSNALHFDTAPLTTTNNTTANQGGTASLYSLNGSGTDVVLSQEAFGSSSGIRPDQAVSIRTTDPDGPANPKTAATDTTVNGTWSTTGGPTGTGTVTFSILGFFTNTALGGAGGIYATGLTLAWAMTCANDVMVWQVPIPGGAGGEVPLPAGLLLLLSGLFGLGFLGRLKGRRAAA